MFLITYERNGGEGDVDTTVIGVVNTLDKAVEYLQRWGNTPTPFPHPYYSTSQEVTRVEWMTEVPKLVYKDSSLWEWEVRLTSQYKGLTHATRSAEKSSFYIESIERLD